MSAFDVVTHTQQIVYSLIKSLIKSEMGLFSLNNFYVLCLLNFLIFSIKETVIVSIIPFEDGHTLFTTIPLLPYSRPMMINISFFVLDKFKI